MGWHLGVPSSEVYGAATTYTELSLSIPSHKTVIVCDGVACREKGAIQILEFLKEKNIDGVEIKTTDCAFMCSVAPAGSVVHTWYGRQVPDNSLAELIEG